MTDLDLTTLATFKNQHLSVSRLKLYEQCARAFFYRYVANIKDITDAAPQSSEAANFGTMLHAALELVYRWIVEEEYAGRFPEGEMIVAYKEVWRAAARLAETSDWRGAPLTGVGLYHEGIQILRTFAQSTPWVNHFDILAVEQEFNIDVGGFKVNGFIDRIDKLDDDTISIVDYKSSRLLFTKSDLETDLQMSIYGLAARSLYPWAKRVKFIFRMLRHDIDQPVYRDRKTIDDAAGYVVALGKRTETDKLWEPTLNENCGYCDHRKRCEKYQAAVAGKHDYARAVDLNDLDAVAIEREAVANIAKIAYGRRDELDTILKAALDQAQTEALEVGGRRYRYINQKETTYDAAKILEAFKRIGVDAAEILTVKTEKALDELLASVYEEDVTKGVLLRADVASLTSKIPGSPRFDSRPIRDAKTEASAKKKR